MDADDAADHVADPEDDLVTYPFSLGSHCKSDTSSKQLKDDTSVPPKKGTFANVKREKNKYSGHNIPKNLKNLIKNLSQIPSKWKKHFLSAGSASLAKGTWTKYNSAYNAFSKFCNEESVVKPWPITKNTEICFILWCKKVLKIKAGSIRSYLTALQTISKMIGFDKKKSSIETAKFLVRGIERSEKRNTRVPKDPLVFEILVNIRKIIDSKKWKKQSKKVIWASICLGYFGSFRASEILTKNPNSFDPSSSCTWDDVKIHSKSQMTIKIKNPKTKGGGTETIELFAFPDKRFCPISAVLSLRKTSQKIGYFDKKLPIFRFESGKFLTVSALSGILKKLLAKGKFKNRKISAKSLRSGVPTDLENHPDLFDDFHIKIWGRWKSDAYQRYMKDDTYQRKWIFGKMCQILTPLCV